MRQNSGDGPGASSPVRYAAGGIFRTWSAEKRRPGPAEAAELLDLMRESGVSVGEGVLFAREAADAIERYFQRDTGKKDAKLQDGSGLTARVDADTPRVFIRPMSSEASPPEDKQRREEEKC